MTALHRATPAPPVRAVHLGLGSFFRAHQAWYTDRADDGPDWGIAAFTGRRPDLADALTGQDGLYTLVTRRADGDEFAVVRSVARAHTADAGPLTLVPCDNLPGNGAVLAGTLRELADPSLREWLDRSAERRLDQRQRVDAPVEQR